MFILFIISIYDKMDKYISEKGIINLINKYTETTIIDIFKILHGEKYNNCVLQCACIKGHIGRLVPDTIYITMYPKKYLITYTKELCYSEYDLADNVVTTHIMSTKNIIKNKKYINNKNLFNDFISLITAHEIFGYTITLESYYQNIGNTIKINSIYITDNKEINEQFKNIFPLDIQNNLCVINNTYTINIGIKKIHDINVVNAIRIKKLINICG
jgi:hypothetical protein